MKNFVPASYNKLVKNVADCDKKRFDDAVEACAEYMKTLTLSEHKHRYNVVHLYGATLYDADAALDEAVQFAFNAAKRAYNDLVILARKYCAGDLMEFITDDDLMIEAWCREFAHYLDAAETLRGGANK